MDATKAMQTIAEMGALQLQPSMEPTMKLFIPLQMARSAELGRHPPKEYSYGPLPRQKLDVYLPTLTSGKAPIIMFLYGGALIQGNKRNNAVIYANVGRFFAEQGFVTVIMDYRLYGAPEDPARYPSGAEDISLALAWLAQQNVAEADTSQVFILANSAGGLHLATFLWADSSIVFKRHHDMSGLNLLGAVFLSTPFHWPANALNEARAGNRNGYYGGADLVLKNSPLALRKRSKDKTPILVAWDEYDPVQEIRLAHEDFLNAYERGEVDAPKPKTMEIKGHNHLSPVYALGLGPTTDEWGREVSEWMRSIIATK